MLTLGIALIFIGFFGILLFSHLMVNSGGTIRRPDVDLAETLAQTLTRLGLTLGFGGVFLLGVTLLLLSFL